VELELLHEAACTCTQDSGETPKIIGPKSSPPLYTGPFCFVYLSDEYSSVKSHKSELEPISPTSAIKKTLDVILGIRGLGKEENMVPDRVSSVEETSDR